MDLNIKQLSNINFLIAEDNFINQEVLKRIIEYFGGKCTTAVNGKEAVEKYMEDKYDLIFMDLSMPEKDGFTAAKEIRDIDKNVVIIALTANSTEMYKEKCIEAGMNDFLTKPVMPEQVLKVVKENIKKITI